MEIDKEDGRRPNQQRPLPCARNILHRPHGSASWLPYFYRNVMLEDFFEETTKDALSGDLPVKRKIEKHRERVVRVDSILKKNPFVQLVPSSKPKLKKSKKTIVKEDKAPKEVQKNVGDDSVMVELWGDDSKGEDESNPRKVMCLL
ncbi:unnamed protein product [Arabidopsis halleri]